MPYKIDEIDWDRSNTPHVFEHGFSESEIEEFVFTSDWVPQIRQRPDGLSYLVGQTEAGRYVRAIGRLEDKKLQLITVYTPKKSERQWFNEAKEQRYEPMPTGPGGKEDFWFWEQQFSTRFPRDVRASGDMDQAA